jgi:predicted ATPase
VTIKATAVLGYQLEGKQMSMIAMVGAHGTGKTTLITALARVIPGPVATVQGIPRRLINEGYSFGERVNLDAVAAYFTEQRRQEDEAVRAHVSTLLTERTLIDAVAYERANVRVFNRMVISADARRFLAQVAIDHINNYHLLVYCPILFALEDDGVRGASTEYQRAVDLELQELITNCGIRAPSISVSGPTQTRVQQVLSAVASLEHSR